MTDWPSDIPPPVKRFQSQDAAQLLVQIETLQNSGDYDWASDTLEGIYATVEDAGYATEGQQRAIDNIEEGGRRSERRR